MAAKETATPAAKVDKTAMAYLIMTPIDILIDEGAPVRRRNRKGQDAQSHRLPPVP